MKQENVLKIGDNLYSGHPFRIISYEDLMKALETKTKSTYHLKEYEIMLFDNSKVQP